jgi:hypothetical protein
MDALRSSRSFRSAPLTLLLSTLAACVTEPTPGTDTGGSSGESSSSTGVSTNPPPPMTLTMPDDTSSTEGLTTSPTDDTTATDPTGTVFVTADMGGSGGTCDVFAQDCPKGEKCMPWADDGGGAWNSTTCSPVMRNPGQRGDECSVEGSGVSGIDDCDLGLMCYNVQAKTNTGTCFELCHGSPDAPMCDEGLCAVYNDGNLPLCLSDCDPLLDDCPGGQLCIASPSANGFVCILDALPASMGDYGAPCTYINDCDPGYFCGIQDIVAGCGNATGCCAEYCDLSQPDPSSQCTGQGSGEECQPWYGMDAPPPGYEDVGFCGIPL